MSRTYRKNPPQHVRKAELLLRPWGVTVELPAIPAVTRDGKVCLSYRREKGWARHKTIVTHRAQCKQALHHDKEYPRYPHTAGWVTW